MFRLSVMATLCGLCGLYGLCSPMANAVWGEEGPEVKFTERPEFEAHRALQRTRDRDGVVLNDFTTDGCSGGQSMIWGFVADAFPGFKTRFQDLPPWESCCVTHDAAYHNAGASLTAFDSFQARLSADEALQSCVVETGKLDELGFAQAYDLTSQDVQAAYKSIARSMYYAVRLGGGPCTGLAWRWGYGYPNCTWF